MKKKLIVSFKQPRQLLEEFRIALDQARKGEFKGPHYEISFNDRKRFNKFIKNIDILMAIKASKPKSIYELAKIMGKDQSNLNKLIQFFENYGVIEIQESKINNRVVKKPIVGYRKIEFDLSA